MKGALRSLSVAGRPKRKPMTTTILNTTELVVTVLLITAILLQQRGTGLGGALAAAVESTAANAALNRSSFGARSSLAFSLSLLQGSTSFCAEDLRRGGRNHS